MAKGARASTNKANNVKLKANVFGPVENARTERLSAKLLELASQPKPKPAKAEIDMDVEGNNRFLIFCSLHRSNILTATAKNANTDPATAKQTEDMEIDQGTSRPSKGRIAKKVRHKSSRTASIVFPKYKNGARVGKSKGKK
ncbi:hypothetical protein LHYA1_G002344 [Lachnellula hyalina]|uniref:DUF2423 domain-containing protein n=1 Tax=Lachnellula hyalina TaxID=1316788 RepID=A0A8H8R6T0_9HELO|nr:uncharacterized protein LHYA1_G002344 [Lachnellula hyalina]TVY28641.1 hypothetical protein LHYA1_G002344 [Lachnellula hyalina]